jgi:murein L,D-transpeptidase YcbB/YkuD
MQVLKRNCEGWPMVGEKASSKMTRLKQARGSQMAAVAALGVSLIAAFPSHAQIVGPPVGPTQALPPAALPAAPVKTWAPLKAPVPSRAPPKKALRDAGPSAAPARISDMAADASVSLSGDPLKDEILALLSEPLSVSLPVRQRIAELQKYYGDPTSKVLWQDDGLKSQFLQRLENASADGLTERSNAIEQLGRFQRVNRFALSRAAHVSQAAQLELYWSAMFLKYATEVKVGRILPTKIDTKLYWQKKEIDQVSALQLIGTLGRVDAFFDAWEPQLPTYKALKKALGEYLEIERQGGWPSVKFNQGDLLKPGMDSDIVPQLRARLAVTDGAPAQAEAGQENVFGEDLVAALKRFQRRHGMDDDGVVGKKTHFQLNIPVAARIRQIVLSMERLRWMPEDLGNDYVYVNIAGYELRRIVGGRQTELMRVVVGKPYHQTPVFSEVMKYVEINPYWNVPTSIAVNEELPKLKANAAARAAKGFEAVVGDKGVPLTSINWSQYSKGNFPIRIRQKPGPGNALGRVKFMFPNRFNVYMHDTPARSLFSESARAFSHGCIRLARPIDMAEQILSTVPNWDRKRIDEVLAKGERTVVSLVSPIAVHITYSTAWRDADGGVQFRPDIYRRDAKLYAALFGKPYPY